jgi:hypothetical protein
MTIRQAKNAIGRQVTYINNSGMETGVITSVNDNYVFVRFGCDYFGKAVNASDLKL